MRRTDRSAPGRICLLILLILLLASALPAKKKNPALEQLPEVYRQWLDEVGLLISDIETETFLELGKDYQRDAFIERFWKVTGPLFQWPVRPIRGEGLIATRLFRQAAGVPGSTSAPLRVRTPYSVAGNRVLRLGVSGGQPAFAPG